MTREETAKRIDDIIGGIRAIEDLPGAWMCGTGKMNWVVNDLTKLRNNVTGGKDQKKETKHQETEEEVGSEVYFQLDENRQGVKRCYAKNGRGWCETEDRCVFKRVGGTWDECTYGGMFDRKRETIQK